MNFKWAKKAVAHLHAFLFQLYKVQLCPGDATRTTIQTERSEQAWIHPILSKNWAKSHSTTEDGDVVIIYTTITKKGESSNLILSKRIIKQASSSAVTGRKGQENQPDFQAENPLVSLTPSMTLGAKALPASAEKACPGASQEWRVGSDIGQSSQQRSIHCLTNAKWQPQMHETSAKAKWEMNRNMLSHPEPSVPFHSFLLFYKLTYCSKSQIFRNSLGWRYYQEKRSVSANQQLRNSFQEAEALTTEAGKPKSQRGESRSHSNK